MNAENAWLQTFEGKQLRIPEFNSDAISLRETATVLSRICRFGGRTRVFYSVAEHSIRVAECVARGYGDDEETVPARSWQGLTVSGPRPLPVVLCHSGSLDRHGALIHHENFPFTTDAIWSPNLRLGNGVAKLHVPLPRICPGCLSIDVERAGTCAYCGAATAEPNLPDESKKEVDFVAREAAPAASTPGVPSMCDAEMPTLRNRSTSSLLWSML